MALTCIPQNSVMHMPTLKNSVVVFAVAILMAIGINVFIENITGYGKKQALCVSFFAFFFVLVLLQCYFQPIVSRNEETAYRYPMLAAIAAGELICILINKKTLPAFDGILTRPNFRAPETVFAGLILVFGIVFAFLLPRNTMTGYDADSHYREMLKFSQGIYTAYDESDTDLMYSWDNGGGPEEHFKKLCIDADVMALSPTRVGYIGSVMGMWFGQILHLNTQGRYLCGRIGNLLLYTVIVYLSIKRLRNGKLLAGLIAMSPVAMQYVVTCSYDAWLLSFTILGFAYFFGAIQRKEKITNRECFIIIGATFIATWVKMPYAVLLLIFFAMPKSKFKNSTQRRNYYIALILCILFEFVFTMMTSFGIGDVADTRGGDDISGYAQVLFIANNPLKYISILCSTIGDLLFKHGSSAYLTTFSFYGTTKTYYALAIGMAVATFIDSDVKIGSILTRVYGIIVILVMLGVIVTTMYIAFTPVGLMEVKGVQDRYKLELLFPFLMMTLSGWVILPNVNRKIINGIAYLLSSACLLINMVVLL